MATRYKRELIGRALVAVPLWVTVVVVFLAPLLFGSIDLFWTAVWLGLLSIGALCCTAVPISGREAYPLFIFVGGCIVYGGVSLLQISPLFLSSHGASIWREAGEILGTDLGARISIRADIPAASIGHFLLFVTAFTNGYYVGLTRPSLNRLSLYGRYAFLIYAIYGLAAFALTPDLILWFKKSAYHGSLTGTFINHNTAATYLGAGMILWFASAFATFQSLPFRSVRILLLHGSSEKVAVEALAALAAMLVCLFALLCTGSRGGLLCTCFGFLVTMMLLVSKTGKLAWRGIAAIALAAAAVLALVLSGLGRIATQGLFDEARWSVYNLCLKAIAERPMLGSGIGTFSDLFPALRNSDLHSWGMWEFAHSTILEIAVEMGLPVAVMISTAAVCSVVLLARASLSSAGSKRFYFAAMAGVATLSYLHSLIDFSLQIPGYEAVYAIMLGSALSGANSLEVGERAVLPKQSRRPTLSLPIDQPASADGQAGGPVRSVSAR